ncbi:Naaa [Symbiodinium sp. CCMP2456]|nr:Naaa [Symbiodinium sp. CCMP2456]
MPEPEIFPSITDQTFDVDLTLFFRYPDFEDAFEADVVNVSGSLTFSNQVNYENSPDPNGRFVIATYSGLTASPAILEIPSTFREICAYTSDKKSLVCSRLVDASLDDRDMGSFGPYAFTETFTFVFAEVNGLFALHDDDANAFVEALVRFGIAEAEAEAFAAVYFGDNGAESGALATAIALVEGLRAATDKNRRFTDLIRLEQVECREFLDWTTCVPSLLRFANPGRGSFLGKVEQEGEEEAKEALDAVAVGSAVRQGCHLPELTPSVAMPASCSCAAGEFPSFLDSGSFSLTLTEFHRFEFPGALNATNATVEQKNVEVQVKSQKNEQGLPQSTGRFVLLRLADEQVSTAVCAYARDQSSLVCARSSLLLQSVEVNAMISLSKFISVADFDNADGAVIEQAAYAAADAFSVLGLDSNAEFTMELSVSDCIPNTCAVKAVELLPAGRGTLLNYVQIVNETTNEVSPVGVSQAVVALGNMTGDSS